LEVKRGDLVTISLSSDYGKPRPALVIQSDLFDAHPSVTVLSVTSELREAPLFRVRVEPTDDNGLRRSSEVMIDKTHTVAREKIGKTIGQLDDESMLAVNRGLAVFLGFA
jgi:mRNA interferase MazF